MDCSATVFSDEFSNFFNIFCGLPTASVVQWSEYLATDPEVRVLFPALPGFLRNSGSGTGIIEELFQGNNGSDQENRD
jgi:hypothetical protein